MQPEKQRVEDGSDSEDDPDYVPPADDADSSDNEPHAKRVRTSPPKLTEEEEAEQKRERDALWASFQASISSSQLSSTSRLPGKKTVKVEKRFRFAGEEVVEVVEVPEDSEDAKKWPLWIVPTEDTTAKSTTSSMAGSASETQRKDLAQPVSSEAVASSSEVIAQSEQSPLKKPGPRKPKTKLGPLPGSTKPKKLTTLDKSAMDWKAHVSSAPDSSLKDELDANRRGGGYLEKVAFLQRVEERKDQTFDANKPAKRRR